MKLSEALRKGCVGKRQSSIALIGYSSFHESITNVCALGAILVGIIGEPSLLASKDSWARIEELVPDPDLRGTIIRLNDVHHKSFEEIAVVLEAMGQ